MTVDISKLRILVVEDDSFTLQLIRQSLHQLNCINVAWATNGEDGFEKYRSAWRKIDLVFCDLAMPVLDGFGFIDKVRNAKEKINRDIPIVILTGNAQEENLQRALALGINGFLIKPASAAALEKVITRAMTSPQIDPKNLQ